MEWREIEVNGRHTVKFPEKALLPAASAASQNQSVEFNITGKKIGGIIKRGEWAWLARECTLQIVSLRNGQTVSTYEFADSKGFENCCIKCVEEVFPSNTDCVLLAVCLESFRGPGGGGSFVALYSVEHSNVLSCMELRLHVTCARFMEAMCCRRSLLQNFVGCLAVGSEEGIVILLDLNVRKLLAMHDQSALLDDTLVPCYIVDYNLPLTEIHRNFRQCRRDGVHFALQIEVIDSPSTVQCILPIDLILGIAIGFEDGRLAFYDLAELQIFYIALPQPQQEMSSLVRMAFLEPTDDPRPCLYVWSLHENGNLTAVMHTLMYEKRIMEDDGFGYFETFQSCSVRLQLELEPTKSLAISCQSITKVSSHYDDDSNSLCVITWYSKIEEKNKLLLFDLNQWYKEEMPFILNWQNNTSYMAGYILNGHQEAINAFLNPNAIAHFNSMQRFEEHFYPNSLSFDCLLLLQDGCRAYNWEGAQNKIINILRSSNASIFLDSEPYFNEILRTRLMPQFSELNARVTFSRNAKTEIILSVALENNCYSLLRDAAKSWSDGSFTGNSTGLSISTLTEWIWKRATDIKSRLNDLCKGLFDFGRHPLDQREQKELGFITRQLKLLADLTYEVLTFSKRYIPESVLSNLELKFKSLRIASDYQNILLWLLNIGLLPEASSCQKSCKVNENAKFVPYPSGDLKKMYASKRAFFGKISDAFISKKTGSCRLLFIDAFIEHECKGNMLREYWLENNGNGLYPPISIESMLCIMLVPDVDFDSKCAILLYFFLDLHMAIDEHAYKSIVDNFIKFPSVFKLSASLIKTVQAFWNLDHGHFLPAVDEFISPFNNNQNYPEWLVELLIESLLTQNASNLALRILEARPSLISPVLQLKTLLSNELISEAFHFARSKHDDSLLELFFSCCLCAGKFGVIRDLALSEKEGQLVQSILKRSKTHGAENLHFVYLLQKSKYIEAVSYMNDLSKARCMRSNFDGTSNMDTPNLVLSAFSTTMTPVTQGLTDIYFRIKNKIKKKEADNKSPVPLSCQLIKQNANNLLGGIYHSSALSAHFATYYWGEMETKKRDSSSSTLLSSNNAPFLRKPQGEAHYLDYAERNSISYPQAYKVSEKRTLAESELLDNSDIANRQQQATQQNPKKRRRLLGHEIVEDLNHFIKMNKNSNRLNINEFSFVAADNQTKHLGKKPNQPIDEVGIAENILTQPLTNLATRPNTSDVGSSYHLVKPLAPPELHSILKTNTTESMDRNSSRREIPVDEEKNIRFRLPSTELEKEKVESAETQNNDDVEEAVEVTVALEPKTESNLKHKILARSISVESNESSSNVSAEDDYYSPLSSQNNSLVVASQSIESSTFRTAVSSHTLIGGPQPRKPLARFSADRSDKSMTPEPVMNVLYGKNSEKTGINKQLYADSKTSSGYASLGIKDSPMASTTSAAFSLQLKSVTSITSKTNEFSPSVSSSRVSETQSKFVLDKTQSLAKLSQCSTVVGSLTSFESSAEITKSCKSKDQSVHAQEKSEIKKDPILDTTLGMSSYDFTVFDNSAILLQSRSSLLETKDEDSINEKDADSELESEEENVVNISDIYADIESEENMEVDNSNILHDEALGLKDNLGRPDEPKDMVFNPASMENQEQSADEDNNAVIVLSSSASTDTSSSSLSLFPLPTSIFCEIDNENESDVEKIKSESESDSEQDQDLDSDEDDDSDDQEGGRQGIRQEEKDSLQSNNSNEVNLDKDDDGNRNSLKVFEKIEVNLIKDKSDTEISRDQKVFKLNVVEPTVETRMKKAEEELKKKDELKQPEVLIEKKDESVPPIPTNIIVEKKGVSVPPISTNMSDKKEEQTSQTQAKTRASHETLSAILVLDSGKVDNKVTEVEECIECVPDQSMQVKVVTSMKEVEVMPAEECNSITDKNEGIGKTATITKSIKTDISSTENKIQEKDITLLENEKSSVINVAVEEEAKDHKKAAVKEDVEEEINLHVDDDDLSENEAEPPEVILKTSEETIVNENENFIERVDKDKKSVNDEKEDRLMQQQLRKQEEFPNKIENISVRAKTNVVITRDNKQLQTLKDNKSAKQSLEQTDKVSTPPKSPKPLGKLFEPEDSAAVLTPTRRRKLRGTSVPLSELEAPSTPYSRGTRGVSVSQETKTESEDASVRTPRISRSTRTASSQLLKSVLDEALSGTANASGTSRALRNLRGTSVPHDSPNIAVDTTPKRQGRGTSVPPTGIAPAAKLTGRRRSALLDAINEDSPAVLDSPSTRTRSRVHLNSMDSELDLSTVSGEQPKQKRRRKTSISSSVSESQAHTPKKTRRNSVNSQTDTMTTPPVLSRRTTKRKNSTEKSPDKASSPVLNKDEKEDRGDHECSKKKEQSSIVKSEDVNETASTSYSSSRRLTRTQLAMLEKSTAFTEAFSAANINTNVTASKISPPTAKRVSKRRLSRSSVTRSTTIHDSDDIESISSHRSNTSSNSKRRVTRSSVKDKDEHEDDSISVASSFGSEKHGKGRSKEKNSPNKTLTVIPEDESEAHVERTRRGKHAKK